MEKPEGSAVHCRTLAKIVGVKAAPQLTTLLFVVMWYGLNVAFNLLNKTIFNYFPFPYTVSAVHVVIGLLYCSVAYLVGAKKASFGRVRSCSSFLLSCCRISFGHLNCFATRPFGLQKDSLHRKAMGHHHGLPVLPVHQICCVCFSLDAWCFVSVGPATSRGRCQQQNHCHQCASSPMHSCTLAHALAAFVRIAGLSMTLGNDPVQPINKEEFSVLFGPAAMHAVGHVAANLSFAAVAISLTHTVKTLEPAFNVALSRIFLGVGTPLPVVATLVPIMVRRSILCRSWMLFRARGSCCVVALLSSASQ